MNKLICKFGAISKNENSTQVTNLIIRLQFLKAWPMALLRWMFFERFMLHVPPKGDLSCWVVFLSNKRYFSFCKKKPTNKQRKHLMKWHIYIIKMWLYMYIFVDIKICIYTKQIWHSHMKMPSNCSPTKMLTLFFVIDKITISRIHSMLWLFQIHSG